MKTRVAIAWLLKEDWPRWQAIDPELPPFDRWLSKIEGAMREAQGRGAECEKVTVDPDQFTAWCKAKGCTINRNSRAEYAATMLSNKRDIH